MWIWVGIQWLRVWSLGFQVHGLLYFEFWAGWFAILGGVRVSASGRGIARMAESFLHFQRSLRRVSP